MLTYNTVIFHDTQSNPFVRAVTHFENESRLGNENEKSTNSTHSPGSTVSELGPCNFYFVTMSCSKFNYCR